MRTESEFSFLGELSL